LKADVRLATFVLVVACLAGPARADESAFVPVPSHTFGLGVIGHATYIAGLPQTGFGPSLELSLGGGRWQLFGEAALAYVSQQTWTSSAYDSHIIGWMGRAGGGLRWLARQYQMDETGAAELYLLAAAGTERFWWHTGAPMTRPDIDVGVAVQMRGLRPRFGMRLEVRVSFAPDAREMATAVCRGTCPTTSDSPGAGFLTGMVFTW
jgi:hypothetical protein